MKKLIIAFIFIFVAWGLVVNDADARRFGGGRSFGMQRSSSSYSRPAAASTSATGNTGNRWLGPLAGLAAGGLLASLFMGHGLASGLLSWLMIGGIGLFLFNLLRSRQTAPQSSPSSRNFLNQVANPFTNVNAASGGGASPFVGFDATDFLRNAKVLFIRLQAAYDSKNINDIREFTAPEVSAEIQMQMQERGDALNHTEVVSVNAELLDATNGSNEKTASVLFTGSIREEVNGPVEPFKEVWHFQKSNNAQKWLLVGLQQN
ncbi:MAG: TIM44-like domain-containing protein [Gammaproteobacteria bacterium]|nr:TIM44-like domain-containing protein [Gammaproteobacteria bacterium]